MVLMHKEYNYRNTLNVAEIVNHWTSDSFEAAGSVKATRLIFPKTSRVDGPGVVWTHVMLASKAPLPDPYLNFNFTAEF